MAGHTGTQAFGHGMKERLGVQCLDKRGMYLLKEHRVECKCAEECAHEQGGKQVFTLFGFESHAGCRFKKWKESVWLQDCQKKLSIWVRHPSTCFSSPSMLKLAFLRPHGRIEKDHLHPSTPPPCFP